jgi:hypothetical protein
MAAMEAPIPAVDEEFLDAHDLQRELKISAPAAYKLLGEIGFRLGKQSLRVRRSRLNEWVAQREKPR